MRVGRHLLANRIVMPPMVIWRSGETGRVTDAHLDHYRKSAGPGLVIVEATVVSPEGRLAATQLGAFSDAQIDGLASLAKVLRDGGAVPGIQLHHAGSRTDSTKNYGGRILAPSRLADSRLEVEELSDEEIRRIIEDFAQAAVRAVQAGFELIEIHGAHGYLGSQFLSPYLNRRTDEWGGAIENRVRFLVEVLSAVRDAASEEIAQSAATGKGPTGRGLTVTVRLGVAEAAGGLSIDDGIHAAQLLEKAGADALHVSHGGSIPFDLTANGGSWSPVVEMGRRVKRAVSIPVIGVGGIRKPQEANSLIDSQVVDLVAVGRAMLADPGWATKTLSGHESRISVCQDCKPRCWHFTDPGKCPARQRLKRIA